MNENLLVRVKPFNRAKGFLTRRYTYRGTRFDEDRGWYEIPAWIAEEMRGLVHPTTGNPIFDVASNEEALEIDEAEEAEEVKRPAEKPHKPASFRQDFTREEIREGQPVPDRAPLDPGPAPDEPSIGFPVDPKDRVAKKKASKKVARSRRKE